MGGPPAQAELIPPLTSTEAVAEVGSSSESSAVHGRCAARRCFRLRRLPQSPRQLFARQRSAHSVNAADADDAYQRALEVMLTKAPAVQSEEQLLAWMHTVVRNEAMQQHRRRKHEVNTAFDEISEGWLGDAPPPDELLADSADAGLGREALGRINPDQTRCLLLRAEGLGYPEICETTGFSYAKLLESSAQRRPPRAARAGRAD